MEVADILSALEWPHLAFAFAVIAILVFRGPLSDLIRRTTTINREGLTASPSPDTQRANAKTSPEAVQQLLDVVGHSIVIAEQEELIRQDLIGRGLATDDDSSKVLIRILAGTQILLAFERVHGVIFGSQIYLLKKLNEVVGQGHPMHFVDEYIEHVKTTHPELADWTSDRYLSFLYSQNLLIRHDDQLHITNLGVEYLTWMVRNGRRDDNPL